MQVNDPTSLDPNGSQFPTIAAALKKLAADNKFMDPDLILDVYIVCACQGNAPFMPDEDLLKDIERTDPKYWQSRLDISKRKEFLERLAQSNYMQALVQLGDPMKAVLTFLDHARKAYDAKITALKGKGPIDHNTSAGTFEGYASEAELDRVISAHKSDPGLAFDKMIYDMTTFDQVTESEEMSSFFSGCGLPNGVYSQTENPGQQLAKAVVQYGVALPKSYPIIFEWYTKLVDQLGVAKMVDKDSEDDSDRKKSRNMEDLDKIQSVDPTEMVQETFDRKVADKSLIVQHEQKEEDGTSHIFVLLDVSGSMMCNDLGGRVCRAFAANVVTLALLNFAAKGNYKVWIVPFAGGVNEREIHTADSRASSLAAMSWLGTLTYDGSSTDIESAVMFAYEKVNKDPTYHKADICLITDGCSYISTKLKDEKPKRTTLRMLLLSEEIQGYGAHATRLLSACDSWAKITWDNMKNEFSVGNTLSGISDPNTSMGS